MTDTDLAVRDPETVASPATGLFGTDKPELVLAKATLCARILKDVIVKQHLAKKIGQSEYILVEGWTTLGALVGVFPKVEWTYPINDSDGNHVGWEAAVVVVNAQGVEIGRAEAECLRAERNWKSRDDFALRSMAQTRAMGKALRMPLGFIAVLAGYEATPAEEMPDVPFDSAPAQDPTAADRDVAHGASGTGGGGAYASDAEVDEVLDVARRVGAEAEEKLLKGLETQRGKYAGKVRSDWLGRQMGLLLSRAEELEAA